MGIRKALVGLAAACSFGLATAAANAGGGSWDGLYLGGQLGYGWGSFDTTHTKDDFFSTAAGETTNLDTHGLLGGVHAGYNMQFGSMLIGAEVAYNAANIRDQCVACLTPAFLTDRFYADVHDLVTVTGRVGYATPSWLLYAKGGWANSQIEYLGVEGPFPNRRSGFKDRVSGWTAGGGAEFKLARSLSLGIEYMFVKFDDDGNTADGSASLVPVKTDIDIHTLMVRLSYQLGK